MRLGELAVTWTISDQYLEGRGMEGRNMESYVTKLLIEILPALISISTHNKLGG